MMTQGRRNTTRGRGGRRKTTRGRGVRQGVSGAMDPPPQNPPNALGPISTSDPSIDIGGEAAHVNQSAQVHQSSPAFSLNDSQSIEVEASIDRQPDDVPSVEESNTEMDRRLVVRVAPVAIPRRFVPSRLTREIMGNVISRMPYPAENWNGYCSIMKEQLFNDFKAKYRFATDYDLRMAKDVWGRTCLDRYSDTLAKKRDKAFKDANSMNFADIKGHGPKGMRNEVWDGLVNIWMKPEWYKKSVAGKNNRASKPENMVHTGGSRSFGEHQKMMEIQLKRRVSYGEVYAKVHKKKNGEFISQNSQTFSVHKRWSKS